MTSRKGTLILLRHGASIWNEKNLFTGWVDVPLSSKGIEESFRAGRAIAPFSIDMIFASHLIRAQMTAMLAMLGHPSGKTPCMMSSGEGDQKTWSTIYSKKTLEEAIPMRTAWQLNERMYGELQGMNKDEARQKFGSEQVHLWRRSFDIAPPGGESLKMTSERTIPYFTGEILSYLDQGKNVLIAAHGNSLRSIVMMLENLSKEQILGLEFPTGTPWIYEWEENAWRRCGE